MTFKKGEKVLTEEGEIGEILFIDRGGLEAQVALARITTKIRCDSLRKFEAAEPQKQLRRSRKQAS
jgi:hypothetical protein